MASADGDDRLVEISLALDDQLEVLGSEVAAAIRGDIEFYSYTSVVSEEELVGNCTDHFAFHLPWAAGRSALRCFPGRVDRL